MKSGLDRGCPAGYLKACHPAPTVTTGYRAVGFWDPHMILPMKSPASIISAVLLSTASILIGNESLSATVNRYDKFLFVCRSVDPSDTRLNLRSQPGGMVMDTISRKEIFYVWGYGLNHPKSGYVPVHLRRPSKDNPRQPPEELPGGWVWKNYITCELSS